MRKNKEQEKKLEAGSRELEAGRQKSESRSQKLEAGIRKMESAADLLRRFSSHLMIDVAGVGLAVADALDSQGIRLQRVLRIKGGDYRELRENSAGPGFVPIELSGLVSSWEADARRRFRRADAEPDRMGKRLIEHGAICLINCSRQIREVLASAGASTSAADALDIYRREKRDWLAHHDIDPAELRIGTVMAEVLHPKFGKVDVICVEPDVAIHSAKEGSSDRRLKHSLHPAESVPQEPNRRLQSQEASC